MIPKATLTVVAAVLLLSGIGSAQAGDYKPYEYLGLDLSRAVLSPKRLGPETQFAPVALEARGGSEAQARAEPGEVPRKVAAERGRASEPKATRTRTAEPRGAARARLAQRRGNPLDAQAMDTRIQTWPCKSGGICDWKR